MTPNGTLTTLHNFEDFNYPVAGLVEGTDGNFYGTTITYADGYGTIFKMTPDGAMTTLRSFSGADGSWPVAPLVEASNGHFYGDYRPRWPSQRHLRQHGLRDSVRDYSRRRS
jgi:uncharacterized repeat protein (TIGR03803 family)